MHDLFVHDLAVERHVISKTLEAYLLTIVKQPIIGGLATRQVVTQIVIVAKVAPRLGVDFFDFEVELFFALIAWPK